MNKNSERAAKAAIVGVAVFLWAAANVYTPMPVCLVLCIGLGWLAGLAWAKVTERARKEGAG